MKTWIRHTLFWVTLLAGSAGLMVINGMRKQEMRQYTCPEILVENADSLQFLSEGLITERISSTYGQCIGRRTDSIALAEIEYKMEQLDVVKKCDVWIPADGVLHVLLTEREPIAKFIKGVNGFYVDADAVIFPLYANYDAPVMTVRAKDLSIDKESLMAVSALCLRFKEDPVWGRLIDTLDLDGKGNISMVPSDNDVKVIFGNCKNIEDKILLMNLWKEKLTEEKTGKKYSEVNVGFENRIICK